MRFDGIVVNNIVYTAIILYTIGLFNDKLL